MTKQGRLNVYIDPVVHKLLKIYAATNDKTISKVVEEAVNAYIKKD